MFLVMSLNRVRPFLLRVSIKSARLLSVDENLTVDVDPTLHYSPTNLLVFHGEVYEFSALGKWADASNDCDADGWLKWHLAAGITFNRLRFHRYFLLCGNLARRESTNFPIGLKRTVQIQNRRDDDSEGVQELFLFANDLCSMYGNNRVLGKDEGGPLCVKITRIA